MSERSLEELLDQLLSGHITPEEAASFLSRIDIPSGKRQLEELLYQRFNNDDFEMTPSPVRQQTVKALLMEKIAPQPATRPSGFRKVIALRRWSIAAAAVVLLAIGIPLFLHHNQPAIAARSIRYKNDVAPGANKATLQLADGSILNLDGSSNGTLASQGQASIVKSGDAVSYVANGSTAAATFYNMISTPVSGQYHLTLSDGTQVWLDAMSSIRYPSSFTGSSREVTITGQAYLEVAKNATHPFVVKTKSAAVQVLGTSFNINTYEDEPTARTTLAEGSIKVVTPHHELLLKPGQQAQQSKTGDLSLNNKADLDAVLAWKNGLFQFSGADIGTIMRQLSRWYGVKVQMKDKVEEEFVADIPRDIPLSQALALLEETRRVHFLIEGKTVTVMK